MILCDTLIIKDDDLFYAPKLKKCPVKGCKDLLETSNRIKCSKCGKIVCVYHKTYESHNCKKYKQEVNQLEIMKQKIELQNKLINELKERYLK